MKEDTKTKLDVLLTRHDQKKRDAELLREIHEKVANAGLDDFYEIRASVIRPAMETIGAHLAARGHAFRITEGELQTEADGDVEKRAHIFFSLIIGGVQVAPLSDYPTLRFFVGYGRVTIHQSTMSPGGSGSAGAVAEMPTSEITPEVVEEKLLSFLTKVFGAGF